MKETLSPTLDDLRMECVLMQAWKKTSSYLRHHSWYADTLEMDFQSLRIPAFIDEIQERLKFPSDWQSRPLELVPAPKGQSWRLKGDTWKPREKIDTKIRPLAHIDLQDQVVATAILMCLADRVEQFQGDPLLPIGDSENRRRVLAYGHRLFCDSTTGMLRHRWGSAKLYRLYYRDYQTFLRRPHVVSDQLFWKADGRDVAIVHSDLSNFYDRVRPPGLHTQIQPFVPNAEQNQFFTLVRRVFQWRWRDEARAKAYEELHDIKGFSSVALPQGLAAAGFFANIALTEIATKLADSIDRPIDENHQFLLKDACFYVDDFRFVLFVPKDTDEALIEEEVARWLQSLVSGHAPDLKIKRSKTKATVVGRQKRFLVPQSRTAERIQQDVSGVFDMLHGTELIGAIEGFFHTQKQYSSDGDESPNNRTGLLIGVSDMRDETAARFAAGRFRKTFRSLRPLLLEETADGIASDTEDEGTSAIPLRLALSKEQLDDRAQFFSALLIEEWVANPGNVRLLRIALDLYPDVDYLDRVLKLLRPGWMGGVLGPQREVRQYCLAELFRAGATESGMVSDRDALPKRLSLADYQERLAKEATELFTAAAQAPASRARFPWFLLQQAFLFLMVQDKVPEPLRRRRGLIRQARFVRSVKGTIRLNLTERSAYLILARSAFGLDSAVATAISAHVSPNFLRSIAEISPDTARTMWDALKNSASEAHFGVARSLGLEPLAIGGSLGILAELVLCELNPFWDERNLLLLASELLEWASAHGSWPAIVTPWQIACEMSKTAIHNFGKIVDGSVRIIGTKPRANFLFAVPSWCESEEDRNRFQLGAILRYALRGSVDLYSSVERRRRSQGFRYRAPISHWERQRYSTFQGRLAFGPPWIPVSSWLEDFLFDLLRWPGCGVSPPLVALSDWRKRLKDRLETLAKAKGEATGLTFLEQSAPWPTKPPKRRWKRPFRFGIVQSITPCAKDYEERLSDPQLIEDASFRTRQRQHLASILEAVIQLLTVRETHRRQQREDGGRIDLLVFPELAIHPLDIQPLIEPFIRSYKCLVLFGQVYHPRGPEPGSPLINSCLWAIPEWNRTSGFQVRFCEQGKGFLTEAEGQFSPQPIPFRPAQWLVEYKWSSHPRAIPLTLSASVCYDATDLALASDLKSRSDMYFVCALNRDVGTFDRMSDGLHYHMFQGVTVVNNGQFGGSSFYMPFLEQRHRQVFHLHGQPQATIAFAEVDPLKVILRPTQSPEKLPKGKWKTPPAKWPS